VIYDKFGPFPFLTKHPEKGIRGTPFQNLLEKPSCPLTTVAQRVPLVSSHITLVFSFVNVLNESCVKLSLSMWVRLVFRSVMRAVSRDNPHPLSRRFIFNSITTTGELYTLEHGLSVRLHTFSLLSLLLFSF